MNTEVLRAKEINKIQGYVPELEIGEVVELNDVWDGNGEVPENRYAYLLSYDPEEGTTMLIDYEFETIEEKENPLDNIVKITNIEVFEGAPHIG